MDERCIHDMMMGTCALCLKQTLPDERPRAEVSWSEIEAQFLGTCAACEEEIQPGERIKHNPEGDGWVHSRCWMLSFGNKYNHRIS